MRVRVIAQARFEATLAKRYYGRIRRSLGLRFTKSLSNALTSLGNSPRMYPHHTASSPRREIRHCPVDRFPYAVVYLVRDEEILIVAIANYSRDPDYWTDRLDF